MNQISDQLVKIFKQLSLTNITLNSSKTLCLQFITLDINDLFHAIQYVNKLRYAPPSKPFNWSLVLSEKCGTCSTKHALLVALGKELGIPFQLGSGIYKMSGDNFPELKDLLATEGLPYIPESHNFIVYDDVYLDITFPGAAKILSPADIEQVQIIEIPDLVRVKTQLYPKFLQTWLHKNQPTMDLDRYALIHSKIVAILGEHYK